VEKYRNPLVAEGETIFTPKFGGDAK